MEINDLTSPMAFAPFVQRSLFSQVHETLQRAIVTGKLQPGHRVNEAGLARQMGISRAPVREAIRWLQQDGLLISIPRRGTVVAALSPSAIEEVYTLRADLEARAIQRATTRVTAEDLIELDRLILTMQAAGAEGDMTALLDADIEFHRTLVKAAGWSHLERMWESLHPRTLTLYTMQHLVQWSAQMHADRHLPVLDAVRKGDPAVAAAAIRHHILEVGAEIMRLSQGMEGAGPSSAQQEVHPWVAA
jgi:DNA-binding GntR family transcriptional regulator